MKLILFDTQLEADTVANRLFEALQNADINLGGATNYAEPRENENIGKFYFHIIESPSNMANVIDNELTENEKSKIVTEYPNGWFPPR